MAVVKVIPYSITNCSGPELFSTFDESASCCLTLVSFCSTTCLRWVNLISAYESLSCSSACFTSSSVFSNTAYVNKMHS